MEILYPLGFDPKLMCNRILDMDETEVESSTPKLLREYGYPNTYTFTKSIAEHILEEVRGDVPVGVFRPSIVGAAMKEPCPGVTLPGP